MANFNAAGRTFSLQFTPAEWRTLLEDASFLRQQDNSYNPPRRLMGVAVEIVPDHRFGWSVRKES